MAGDEKGKQGRYITLSTPTYLASRDSLVMDFDDDLIPLPDSSGSLDLSSRSWTRIDPTVWGMGRLLLDLNLSYNRIFDIPPEIGNLEMLK